MPVHTQTERETHTHSNIHTHTHTYTHTHKYHSMPPGPCSIIIKGTNVSLKYAIKISNPVVNRIKAIVVLF